MYVVSGRCFRFAISLCYSEVIRLESAEVGENSPTVGQNLQIFAFENVGDTDGAPLICVIKLHHIPTSWQRSRGAAFFGLGDYSAKK